MNLKQQDNQQGNQAQYNKKYAIYYQKSGEEDLKQIVLELPSIFTVGDCIDFTIDQIKIQDSTFQFSGQTDRFKLKVAKKNGKPKDDLPALDNEQQLIDTGAIVFALVLNQNQQQFEKQITFAPTNNQTNQINQSNQTQQQQVNLQDSSIKQRTSYSNSLSNNKKSKNGGNDQKNDANGFCFFKQCA
ncbi:unnamed protein product [Paramecium primaurelia]|uniref:CRIM domain-containing protein n=1 Tax=Paramecium primaurelia TaxID=5886 RepID=A0A8S1NHS0_PARPR|nr:unnamed protein product [Paramecium primaurelia]